MFAVPVFEASQAPEARRRAAELAEAIGFSATGAGRVSIVVTELATNLLKHAGGGELLIGCFEDDQGAGVEILSLDNGPGISNLQACLADGYSSAGTAGNGLGAIFRQSHSVDVVSWPGAGAAILARLESGRPPAASQRKHPAWGAVSLPLPGEEVCGDAWWVLNEPAARTVLVADGLGHGPAAATAAAQAVKIFRSHAHGDLKNMIETIHLGLRSTRGAAVSVARTLSGGESIDFAGLGNVSGVICSGSEEKRMISLPGTAGHNARKIQTFNYPFKDGWAILHSDGLGSGWTLARYPGLMQAHPALIAGVLYRDFARKRDDVTIVVASGDRV